MDSDLIQPLNLGVPSLAPAPMSTIPRQPMISSTISAPLHSDDKLFSLLHNFWATQKNTIARGEIDFKYHPLPLARVKKVMKSDPSIKQMISSEAPFIFSKACEIFIAELTLRAWLIAEDNKRRTLQRNDIMAAVTQSDQYDFLIDVVPHDDSDITIVRRRGIKDQTNISDPQLPNGFDGHNPPPTTMLGYFPPATMDPNLHHHYVDSQNMVGIPPQYQQDMTPQYYSPGMNPIIQQSELIGHPSQGNLGYPGYNLTQGNNHQGVPPSYFYQQF